jgi:acyl-CoA dehydrogenase
MFVEAIEAILADECTPQIVRAIEAGASPAPLWSALADAGFLELLAPEAMGGAELGLDALYAVIESLGRYAVPVPVAQSVVARALLVPHDIEVPQGMITFGGALRVDADGAMRSVLTPYGLVADVVLVEHDGDLLVLPCGNAKREPCGVHGSMTATLQWAAQRSPRICIEGAGEVLHACAAIVHAALLAGAMNRVLALSLQYANDRAQFGKPIGKFQAIQQQLAVMAEQVAAASIAAERGYHARGALPDAVLAAIAKARTSEAVTPVAAIAHALHGAMGVTEEYDLQLYTRRMHEWRIAHGAEYYWNARVGEALLASGRPVADFVRARTQAA